MRATIELSSVRYEHSPGNELDDLMAEVERGDVRATSRLLKLMAADVDRLARLTVRQAGCGEWHALLSQLALCRLQTRLTGDKASVPFRDIITGRPSYQAFEEFEHTVVKSTILKMLEVLRV